MRPPTVQSEEMKHS